MSVRINTSIDFHLKNSSSTLRGELPNPCSAKRSFTDFQTTNEDVGLDAILFLVSDRNLGQAGFHPYQKPFENRFLLFNTSPAPAQDKGVGTAAVGQRTQLEET
ncbi:MAG: hypothetical protein FJW26_16240 [Acidimicrobiia bacterium]|nr:hypothetical protein [Acidimicrobiia bacterium]